MLVIKIKMVYYSIKGLNKFYIILIISARKAFLKQSMDMDEENFARTEVNQPAARAGREHIGSSCQGQIACSLRNAGQDFDEKGCIIMKQRFLHIAVVFSLLFSLFPIGAMALTNMGTNPGTGQTIGQPFAKGTAGSNSFRIPGLVTLSDGSLLAVADARWNTTYDGGGLDTIVSRSTNNGATWKWSFANYLGDNGNRYSGGPNNPSAGYSGSTCFIDPSIALKYDSNGNETIYLLADIYPYGVALNGQQNLWPSNETGFDSKGRLLLSNNTYGTETQGNNKNYVYNFYLDQETGKIKSLSNDAVQQGYTVDAHFNITGNGHNTNLFFADSPFKVQRTSYLYLITSTDRGETWSKPTLIPVKKNTERAYLAAPSRGIVTSQGEIVYPCYSYAGNNDSQRVSFIYSSDGVNWNRSVNAPIGNGVNWHSESVAVELSDGRLRFFLRSNTSRLTYIDFTPGANGVSDGVWGRPVVEKSIPTNSNCQISAIKYSKTSEGKEVLLVSCPTGPNEAGSNNSAASARLNGKIFVGLVNNDTNRSMAWVNNAKIDVTSNGSPFMYSAMTELPGGNIGILYENHESKWGAGDNCYYTMKFETKALSGINFDSVGTTKYVLDVDGIDVGEVYAITYFNGITDRVLFCNNTVTDVLSGKEIETTPPLNSDFDVGAQLWKVVDLDNDRIALKSMFGGGTYYLNLSRLSDSRVHTSEMPVEVMITDDDMDGTYTIKDASTDLWLSYNTSTRQFSATNNGVELRFFKQVKS